MLKEVYNYYKEEDVNTFCLGHNYRDFKYTN